MDERKEPRKKVNMLLKVGDTRGILVDVSKMGLRVTTDKFPENENVDVSLRIRNKIIDLKGTVHWVEIKQTLAQEPYEMGLSIINPDIDFTTFVESLPQEDFEAADDE